MYEPESPLSEKDANLMNTVTLAFLGDAVFTLYVREKISSMGDFKPGKLQKMTADAISAKGQNDVLEKLMPRLTEKEAEIFRRARNAKKPTKAKHATVEEYNRSTGFEAVLGYLYITGQSERLGEILDSVDIEGLIS